MRLIVASLLAIASTLVAGPPLIAAAQATPPTPTPLPAPSVQPTPTPLVPLINSVGPFGRPASVAVPPTGGQLSFADGTLIVQAFPDPTRPALTLSFQGVDARTLPAAQSGLSLGFGAFQLSALDDARQAPVTGFTVPINLVITPGASDMALAIGRIERLYLGTWNGSSWSAVPCAPDAISGTRLVCSVTQPGLFVPIVVLPTNPLTTRLDFELTNGHFYTQGNGFRGGGGLGFAVLDDGDAPMWSEFQRLGGTGRLGFPISQRFLYGGAVTQAFQRGALQWVPEIGQSVPLNILDELHTRGSDAWMDATRQVPPAPASGAPADVSILEPFPTILAAYLADPELYGLPVAIKDYGQLGGARFQRSTLQVWQTDQPDARAGDVIPGSSGDLARAAGLWPLSATTAGGPPPS